MSEDPLFPHLRKAWPFGCLAFGLLASGIGGIVLLGSLLGTCDPSIGCSETNILAQSGVGAIDRFIIRRTNMAGLQDFEEAGSPFGWRIYDQPPFDVRGGSCRSALLQPCCRPSIQDR
ncbi:hypothetical protein [Sphingomonas aerolata]|uniref:hypothetical protein n=1 Tax=Sphingomonas aerolata TaxID=185951 RepID=UPI00141B3336|nr:hypothetical protein [Sphingomonas aerolata]NII58545.1 hypothetical protein [Sphingomonas aerolata]